MPTEQKQASRTSIHWTKVAVEGVNSDSSSVLEVSNPLAPLPLNCIRVIPDFLSAAEAASLNDELAERQERDSTWDGFDGPRRRVQGYEFNQDECTSIPKTLIVLQRRLQEMTGLVASHAKVEDAAPVHHKLAGQDYDPTILSQFPSPQRRRDPCPCQQRQLAGVSLTEEKNCSTSEGDDIVPIKSSCSCFVVEIPLLVVEEGVEGEGYSPNDTLSLLLQNWNQPESRTPVCWKLHSPAHHTDVRLHVNSAIVKRSYLLTEWRSSRVLCTSVAVSNVRTLQFYSLATAHGTYRDEDDTFGFIPTPQDDLERSRRLYEPMPPLSELLTIIVTTSPIKSNPSTEVLERAMGTFVLCGPEFAFQCRKVIVCDGFRMHLDDGGDEGVERLSSGNPQKVSRRHTNDKQAMRNGIVNSKQADNYLQFKENLRQLCADAAASDDKLSVFRNAIVVELEKRHGYGFALRHVVRNCIDTPYVCVVQHDRTFMRPTPMIETVRAMWNHANIKYAGFSMRSNLMYRDIFLGKYGGGLQQFNQHEWSNMVLYVPELLLPATDYGPDSASTKALEIGAEKLRLNILALVETYKGSAQAAIAQQASEIASGGRKLHQLSLVPSLYWYDNIHVCTTAHYRDFVFDPSYKMCARGGFIEDKLSPVLKRTVERLGLREGHSRFGCYLLDDHSGMFFTGHLDGGSYMSAEDRTKFLLRSEAK